MKTIFTFLASVAFACLISSLLLSCDKWELPTRKTQRNCVKPAGTLTAQIQQRKVDFSITNSTGTIDKVTWDFGNGSTTATTGLTVTYTYPTSGTYAAKATLSNSCGQETIASLAVSVADASSPTVSLQTATNITLNSAVSGMTVTSYGNATITQYGICYSSINMVPDKNKDSVRYMNGPVELNKSVPFTLSNLQPNTTYYVRSFAVNSSGIPGYSTPVQTFKTGSDPSVSVASTPTIGVTTSTVGMVILNAGNPAAVEYGICYSSNNTTPKAENSTTKAIANPTVGANINVDLVNLTPNTRYYYCAYAKLPNGNYIYSSVQSFTTQIDTLVQDLIASVSFTDGSLFDISGNNNNVNRVGNQTFTTDHNGKANSAILLNGLGDYFFMADNSTLRPDAFSISIWIKPIALDRDPTGWMSIYNKSRFNEGTDQMYSALIRPTIGADGITINTDIRQGSSCQSSGWKTLSIGTGIVLNQWRHIVFTYNGGQVGKMYIDGVLLYTKPDFDPTGMVKCPGGELKFGAEGKSDTNYFYGAMDDIRMYRRVLTDNEVLMLKNQ